MQNSGVMWFSAIVLEIFAVTECEYLKGYFNARV